MSKAAAWAAGVELPDVYGISEQALRTVLKHLAAGAADVSRRELARRCGLSRAVVTHALGALERAGLIAREERFGPLGQLPSRFRVLSSPRSSSPLLEGGRAHVEGFSGSGSGSSSIDQISEAEGGGARATLPAGEALQPAARGGARDRWRPPDTAEGAAWAHTLSPEVRYAIARYVETAGMDVGNRDQLEALALEHGLGEWFWHELHAEYRRRRRRIRHNPPGYAYRMALRKIDRGEHLAYGGRRALVDHQADDVEAVRAAIAASPIGRDVA